MSDIVIHFAQNTIRKMAGQDVSSGLDDMTYPYTYLPASPPSPLPQEVVQQYVELFFALSVREGDLLKELVMNLLI